MKTLLSTLTIFALLMTNLSAQTPDFSPNHSVSVCGPTTVYFVCIAPLDPHNINWDFGDGTTATGISVVHSYTTTGMYDVKLVIEKDGVKDSLVKTNFVTIRPKPESKFEKEVTQLLDPFKRGFKFTGFSNSVSIDQYDWKVNDTSVATTPNLLYTFPRADWFTISLEVTNDAGCSDVFSDSLFISGSSVELATNEVLFKNNFKVSTTPDNQLRIESQSGNLTGLSLVLYDITGKKELDISLGNQQRVWLVDTRNLHHGLHIIEISNNTYVAVKRLQMYMQ
jgi:PKD repeat protein